MDAFELLTGFVVSTIGFSVFLYGKRQRRSPQLVCGVALMAAPFACPNPWWTMSVSAAALLATRAAVVAGH